MSRWSDDDLFRVAVTLGGAAKLALETDAPEMVRQVLFREYDPTHRGEPDLERLRDGLRGVLAELRSALAEPLAAELEQLLRWTEIALVSDS